MARVLIVDDELDQLSVRRQLLEHAGYEVVTAQTAAEALQELAGCQVLLMDLRIPKIEDGLALIRAAAGTTAHVIVLSGAPADTPLEIDEFLPKPCSSKRVLEAVARFCGSAHSA